MCRSIHVDLFAYIDDHEFGQIYKYIHLIILLPLLVLKDGMVGITLVNNAVVSVIVVMKSP